MEKMKFETISGEEKNISLLAKIFPNCVTEGVNQNGDPVKTVNFEILRQILSAETDDSSERYEFTWPGNRESLY